MPDYISVRLVHATLLAIFMAASLFAQSGPPPPGTRVNLSRVVQRGAPNQQLYDVNVSYSFGDRATVWLQGVGVVLSSGELALTLRTNQLIFKASKDGLDLASIRIEPTEIQQTPATGNPYPSSVLSTGWQQDGQPVISSIAPERSWTFLTRNLNETYGQTVGPTPCRPDDEGCLLTQWTSLTMRSETIQVQTAVMVVISAAPKNQTSFKIYYMGRQALIGEKLNWDTSLDGKSRELIAAKLATLRSGLSRTEGKE